MRQRSRTVLNQQSTIGRGPVANSLLADQQDKSSDSYQQGKQNTDDERNNRMPSRLDLFRSSAFLRRSETQPKEKFVHQILLSTSHQRREANRIRCKQNGPPLQSAQGWLLKE